MSLLQELELTCPVCGAHKWLHVETFVYRQGDLGLDDYERLRRRILFEVWHPDSADVRLDGIACRDCGVLTYAPRPSEEDIAAKYRFLQEHERNIGGSAGDAKGARRDQKRARRTFKALRLREPARVLDFGGGDGKLLAPFVAAGHDCYLVDYNTEPLPGVRKLADTLAGVDQQFEAIICSHVLEHVAAPLDVMRDLRARLTPGGRIYVEVPSEVWRGLPIARDPVTHVNFFTVGSLERLFALAGFPECKVAERAGSYGANSQPVIVGVAELPNGFAETRGRLEPGFAGRVVRVLRERRLPRIRRVLTAVVRYPEATQPAGNSSKRPVRCARVPIKLPAAIGSVRQR